MPVIDFFEYISDLREYAPQLKSDSKIESLAPYFRPQKQRIISLIGQPTYDLILNYYGDPNPVDAKKGTAVDHIKGAIANMIGIPYFIFEASERNNTDNRLFRYQENQQIDQYLELFWNELSALLNHLETNSEVFPAFQNMEQHKVLSSLFLKKASEFNRYYHIGNSSYFFSLSLFIMEEIQRETLSSRHKEFLTETDENVKYLIGKYITFETISRACIRFDYTELPKAIRNSIVNEISAKKGSETEVKEKLSIYHHNEADKYLLNIEEARNESRNEGVYVLPPELNSEDDKIILI